MSDMVSFTVAYDKRTDVLYIAARKEPAAKGTTDDYGIVWRYDSNGKLIGATVMDFHEYWDDHLALLERQLSDRFDVPVSQMRVVLKRASENP
jgi:uncharacterized protein YuzE